MEISFFSRITPILITGCFGHLRYNFNINQSSKQNRIVDSAEIKIYGKYSVVLNDSNFVITKTEYGRNCNFSVNNKKRLFDSLNARKTVYNITDTTQRAQLLNMPNKPKELKGGRKVEIYQKRKIKNDRTKRELAPGRGMPLLEYKNSLLPDSIQKNRRNKNKRY